LCVLGGLQLLYTCKARDPVTRNLFVVTSHGVREVEACDIWVHGPQTLICWAPVNSGVFSYLFGGPRWACNFILLFWSMVGRSSVDQYANDIIAGWIYFS
jgi:hypothetical protein